MRAVAVPDLLVALNASPWLPREKACRLALGVASWAEHPAPAADPALAATLGVDRDILTVAERIRRRAGKLAAEARQRAAEVGAEILSAADEGYPAALADLPQPPPAIYVQGRLPPGPAVTVVGSRRVDLYGREVAELFASELAAAGAIVVSGFAYGVDATAHRAALAAPEGRTVAVLGCGLAVDYPRGHAKLGREIALRGARISEFPPDTPPAQWQFPVRNRILAALSQATLVVRAAARSGSLITVRHALELGRDVYAVPGRIFEEGSQGPNALIRDGAYPVQHPREILEHLKPPLACREKAAAAKTEAGETDPLLAALPPAEERMPEDLAAELRRPLPQVMSELLEHELQGRVRRLPGGGYCRRLV